MMDKYQRLCILQVDGGGGDGPSWSRGDYMLGACSTRPQGDACTAVQETCARLTQLCTGAYFFSWLILL